MARHYLGVIILALGAAGVVWIAVEQRPTPKAATARVEEPPLPTPTPSTVTSAPSSPPPSPSPSTTASSQASDAQAFPALVVYAAWSVVRWGMTAAEVEGALEEAGVVVDATDTKRIRANKGSSEARIELGAKGVERIVVTSTKLTKDEALAAIAKVEERAPATKTTEHAERHWNKEGAASASLVTDVVTVVGGSTATVHEEHVRERSPGGAVGFAGLRWGMSTQEVVGQLTAAGYAAHVEKPPAGPATVPFTKGDVEGRVSFNQFGLRHVAWSGPALEGGATRAKELETSLGKPTSLEASTTTQHVDVARATSIDLEVTERQPDGSFTVVETYRPTAAR